MLNNKKLGLSIFLVMVLYSSYVFAALTVVPNPDGSLLKFVDPITGIELPKQIIDGQLVTIIQGEKIDDPNYNQQFNITYTIRNDQLSLDSIGTYFYIFSAASSLSKTCCNELYGPRFSLNTGDQITRSQTWTISNSNGPGTYILDIYFLPTYQFLRDNNDKIYYTGGRNYAGLKVAGLYQVPVIGGTTASIYPIPPIIINISGNNPSKPYTLGFNITNTKLVPFSGTYTITSNNSNATPSSFCFKNGTINIPSQENISIQIDPLNLLDQKCYVGISNFWTLIIKNSNSNPPNMNAINIYGYYWVNETSINQGIGPVVDNVNKIPNELLKIYSNYVIEGASNAPYTENNKPNFPTSYEYVYSDGSKEIINVETFPSNSKILAGSTYHIWATSSLDYINPIPGSDQSFTIFKDLIADGYPVISTDYSNSDPLFCGCSYSICKNNCIKFLYEFNLSSIVPENITIYSEFVDPNGNKMYPSNYGNITKFIALTPSLMCNVSNNLGCICTNETNNNMHTISCKFIKKDMVLNKKYKAVFKFNNDLDKVLNTHLVDNKVITQVGTQTPIDVIPEFTNSILIETIPKTLTGEETNYIFNFDCDNDGDGYLATFCGGNDCNDNNPNVYPSALEICNGLDDDCNILTADGSSESWYNQETICGLIGTPCENTKGKLICNNGTEIDTCNSLANAVPETCNNLITLSDGIDNNCDGITDPLFNCDSVCDKDNDGYTDNPLCIWKIYGDCNDNDPFINVKNTYFRDFDNDGFGNMDNTIKACSIPLGYVDNNLDCNDNNYSINPDAIEIPCNGIDENCNPIDDLGTDLDQDGYGIQLECGGDCNDTNPLINPGVIIDLCDGIDSNCDGLDCECNHLIKDISGNLPPIEICNIGVCSGTRTCTNLDNWGSCILTDPNCNIICIDNDRDGYNVTGGSCGLIDCNDSNSLVNPDALEICNGIDDNCDGLVDAITPETKQLCNYLNNNCITETIDITGMNLPNKIELNSTPSIVTVKVLDINNNSVQGIAICIGTCNSSMIYGTIYNTTITTFNTPFGITDFNGEVNFIYNVTTPGNEELTFNTLSLVSSDGIIIPEVISDKISFSLV
ncbi:MAG: putative metal-binding motif-containing protein [Candidatus Nanoarchaeia archaeon]|nr:putative metal-binding motif-containing protein [Candidatus Nanoarchaeia archaeon]